MTDLIPVFDGHNDALLRLYQSKDADPVARFIDGLPGGHIDLPRARKGGLAGGMFAIFPPPLETPGTRRAMNVADEVPPELARADALAPTLGMASILMRLERASDGAFTVCRSAGAVCAAMEKGSLAAVFHIEGVEAVDMDLVLLDVLHAAGLRSLGPVWSRPNAFAHGVPFRFPATPEIGPGLTEAGKALVKACNRLRILVDLSHLNAEGFRDVAKISDAPLVATHSNVHALCGHSRNLMDWQLAAIRDTGGLVGLNFATGFLREDGRMGADTGLDVMIRHLDALLEALGEGGVAFGSDFDGATVPAAIGDASGLPKLIEAMESAGYGRELIEKIAWRNWVDVLERTIG
ncbi:dipeptidase [Nitratireductor pacificus]|uniref:Membrane dipeptidase n=1 Tax=Nitratireductor pacificus pht-3B TaxID=391937 RepID=K2MJR7_9HYPH|nr:dipeptidase [Nitratireductor pacificus]EKF20960.1 membrane dipeptidase [Nitratireductor pacificus pht-3B]